MQSWSNEALIRRAHQGGRNLMLLGVLAGLATVLFVFGGVVLGQRLMLIEAIGLALATVGFGLLSKTAYRGEKRAADVVIGIIIAHFVFLALPAAFASARSGGSHGFGRGLMWVILVLIAISLFRSRRILAEIRRRELGGCIPGFCEPSQHLCMMGGTLLGCGLIAFWGGIASRAAHLQSMAVDMEHAAAFVGMLKAEEKEFRNAVTGSAFVTPEGVETAAARLAILEASHRSLSREAVSEPLKAVLVGYGKALKEWRLALDLMRAPDADLQVVHDLLTQGDKLRDKAAKAFDEHYVKK